MPLSSHLIPALPGHPARTLNEALAHAALAFPTKGVRHIHPSSGEASFQSYVELSSEARALACVLLARGLRQGSALVIAVQDSRQFLVLFWACLLAGIRPAPVAPLPGPGTDSLEAEKIRQLLPLLTAPLAIDSRSDCLADAYACLAGSLNRLLAADELLAEARLDRELALELPQIEPGDVAVLQFSSGSSGAPKGVPLSHRNLLANIAGLLDTTAGTCEDILCSWLPYFHDFGLFWGHLAALCAGMDQIKMDPAHFARRPLLWLELLSASGATLSNCTPTGLRHTLNHLRLRSRRLPTLDLSRLRGLCIGAEMIQAADCRELLQCLQAQGLRDEVFIPGYGLTETTVVSAAGRASEPLESCRIDRARLIQEHRAVPVEPSHGNGAEFTAVGRPVLHCQIRLVDEAGQVLPPDSQLGYPVGRIQIRGPHVAEGYYQQVQATAAAFVSDEAGGQWFDSGDMGFVDEQGRLYITGRAKELIIVNGHNYYPYDLEQLAKQALADDALIKFLCVCGYYDPAAARDAVALFYTPSASAEGLTETLAGLAATINERAGFPLNHLVPIATRDIPRTSSGKVMRRLLVDGLLSGRFRPDPEIRASSNTTEALDIEAVLRQCWAEALKLAPESLQPDQHLFELGCDSIRAALIVGRLEDRLNLKLPIRFAYEHPTLAAQIQQLRQCDGRKQAPRSEIEAVVQTVVRDSLNPGQRDLGTTQPLLQLARGPADVLRLGRDLQQVFELDEDPAALLGQDIQSTAAQLTERLKQQEQESFALMHFQETLYFHRKGFVRDEPSGLSCFIFIDLRIEGPIHAARLQQAFELLIARHPMLRAVIDEGHERPRLRVLETVPPFSVSERDLSAMEPSEQEACLQARGRELNDLRFDMGRWPLFVAELVKLGADRHALLFNVDHLLVDGYSFMQLLEELLHAHEDLAAGRVALAERPLPTMQFRDYVRIERLRQRTASYERAMQFQLDVFRDLPPRARLPFKRDPAALPSVHFDTLYRELKPHSVARLKQLAASRQIGLNALLMAAYFKVINLWSNQDDLIINMPVFNREQYFSAARQVLGSFIDIFPVRLKTHPEQSVLEMACRIEAYTRELLRQPVSSIELSRRIAQRDGLSAGSMSNLIFSNSIGVYGGEVSSMERLRVKQPRFRTGAPGTYIDLVLYDYEGQTQLNWNYVRELFDERFALTLAEQYERVLAHVLEEAQESTRFDTACALLPHHRQLWSDLNQSKVDYPERSTLPELIDQQIKRSPQSLALFCEGESLSYQDFGARVNRLARLLQAQGVGRGQFVALLMHRSIDMLVAQAAVMKAGAAYVPIDPAYPVDRVRYVLEDSAALCLLTQQTHGPLLKGLTDMAEPLRALRHVVMMDAEASSAVAFAGVETLQVHGHLAVAAQSPALLPAQCSAEDFAYMIYTSGSTGRPKGVPIRHRNILNFLHWVGEEFRIEAQDRFALVSSYAFDMTLASNWVPLLRGASLHILHEERTRDVEQLLRFISERHISFLNVTPSHFSLLAQARAHLDLPPLPMVEGLRIMLGGETISPKDLNLWLEHYPGHHFINEYGPTEVSVASTFYRIPLDERGRVAHDVVPIGRPLANNKVYILGTDGALCLPGVAGELCLGGVGVASGYHQRPDLTARAFVTDPFAADGSLMYRTGDQARLRDDGLIEFLGRKDHQINLRGFRIEAGEVEAALRECPGVAQVVVTARPDAAGQAQLVAYYTGTPQAPQTLRDHLSARLPAHMVPAHFEPLERLPTTASGKLDLAALPAVRMGAQRQGGLGRKPRGGTEATLLSLWREILGDPQLTVDDDFWLCGGDSLKAMRLIVAMREQASVRFGLREMFAHPSVAQAAAWLDLQAEPASAAGDLLVGLHADASPGRRYVLLPYACGNATAFVELAPLLGLGAEVFAVNPCGDVTEAPLAVQPIATLAARLAQALKALPPLPTVLVGYSYGAWLGHELALRLQIEGHPPVALVLACANPPDSRAELELIASADDADILQRSRELYGFEASHLPAAETESYLKLLRAQTASMLAHGFDPKRPLTVPTLVLVAEQEEDLDLRRDSPQWSRLCEPCEFGSLPGRHMSIKSHPGALANAVRAFSQRVLIGSQELCR